MIRYLLAVFLAVISAAWGDWPQLQQDAARSGRGESTVKPPLRARWIWMGPDHLLRNQESKPDTPGWDDDLKSRSGHTLDMPESLPFSFAMSMQPIVLDGMVFVADSQSKVYALGLDDGELRWSGELRGGSLWPGVVTEQAVCFASVRGVLNAWQPQSGRELWSFDSGKAISSAPLLYDGRLYVANHGGQVMALQPEDGKLLWQTSLSAPVVGGLCAQEGRVYVGDEKMFAYALDAASGKELARKKLTGQSFRLLWPVAAKKKILFNTVPAICVGSEHINDPVLAGLPPDTKVGWQPDIKPGYVHPDEEQQAVRDWLNGEGYLWESIYALDPQTLAKDYIVPTGPTEGCGAPPNPAVMDADGYPLLWFATAHPTLTGAKTGFGSNFGVDVMRLNLETGMRIPIDNDRYANITTETDNLYGLSLSGPILYLFQHFRGVQAMNLETSRGYRISAHYRYRDGGGWIADLNYAEGQKESHVQKWDDDVPHVPETPPSVKGRVGVTVTDDLILFTETFAVTCMEADRD